MSDLATKATIWTEVAAVSADLGRGDRSALTRLYDLTAPRLLRYAETLTRNRADAEDAMQSALVKVARKPKQLANADKPWAYLVRVVRNEALKVIGRRRPIASLASLLQAWRPVECPLEQQESREKVQQAVAKLPAEQAEVVVLKIWEQFTFAEIAELIGESPNTAASRYRYALEKLSRHLQPLVDSARADIDTPARTTREAATSESLETRKSNSAKSDTVTRRVAEAAGRRCLVSETKQLFAALGDDVPDFEPTDWEFAAEEELIFFCDDARDPRAGLRTELLIQLDRIDRGRELASRLTVMASFMIAAILVVFGPRHDAGQAEAVAQVEPVRMSRFPLGSPTSGPAVLVEASRATDSWALVEAYNEIRQQHRAKLPISLSAGTVQ